MTEAILARSGRDSTRLAAGWLRLAVASLMLAGFTAILVALARTPGLQALVGPQGFRLFLVGHVNFSLTVWCLGFISAAWAWLATREGYGVPDRLGKPGLALGAAGTLAMAIATILAQGRPLLVDYLPLITHPLFELGLIAFFGGTTLMALGFLAGTSWFPLTGPDRRSFPVQALRIAALAEIAAVIALLVAVTAGWRGDWQLAAWGGGHLLQVANASAMVGLWWYLAAGAEAPAPRWLSRTLPIYLLPCIGIPALYLMPGHTPVAIMRDLNWTAVAIPTTLAVGATFLRLWNTAPLGATHHAALTSLILFSLGLGMALMGLEGDTRVTAHYHGTVGAVTVAFMGLAFRFLPDLGLSLRFGRLSRLLPQMYGFGLMLLIAGLYWASMFGGQRKVFETFAHQQGLWGPLVPFGAGAVVTVIAGIAFIWVLGASAFGRPVAAAQLAVPAAEAAPPLAGPSPIP
ncbi:MAG: hypothetical protein FJZ01_21735, partial [Candidatus Sericytochromatia bacterium]|nr:hypothetical protein [Candidatus Tanganyikabacteria bacterium]